MNETTLYCSITQNIGQVSEERADSEIERLNKQSKRIWRKDYSTYMFCDDETDENVNNPTKLINGYCWITCVN